jgi:peptide/nickel transport system substrate-binding protein
MRRKHAFSLLMLTLGVALLVAATAIGVASSATRKVGSSKSLRGGTLRVDQSAGAFDTLDPGLAYVQYDWQVLYSTQLLLVNYPNKPGQGGGELFPEAAKAFPTVSSHGKTVTFHLRKGLRLSDGSEVTARCYQRAFERILSPHMFAQYGIFDGLNTMVTGAQAFAEGKAAHISGIEAKGLTLAFHLTKPNATFLSILAMPWLGAVKPNMPYTKTSGGVLRYPSGGPYYIATNHLRGLVVLKRNPYYHGVRPANPNEIVIHSYPYSNGEAALLQIEKDQVDYDMAGVPAPDVQAVAQKYGGPNKSQFHVGTETCLDFVEALNTNRPPTNDVRVREALNYAIGRMPIISLLGPYAGTPTDQVIPPGVNGYKKLNVYPNNPNVAKAEQVGGGALQNAAPLNIYYNPASQFATGEAELEQSEIQQIGLTANLMKANPQDYYGLLETKGTPWNIAHMGVGWCSDYLDPSEFINLVLSDLKLINFSSSTLTKEADQAASLSGTARARAYAALDKLLMTKYAPVVPLEVPNFRYLTSKRVHNIIFSHYYGAPVLNAMSVG